MAASNGEDVNFSFLDYYVVKKKIEIGEHFFCPDSDQNIKNLPFYSLFDTIKYNKN